jgi:hypothetical protein
MQNHIPCAKELKQCYAACSTGNRRVIKLHMARIRAEVSLVRQQVKRGTTVGKYLPNGPNLISLLQQLEGQMLSWVEPAPDDVAFARSNHALDLLIQELGGNSVPEDDVLPPPVVAATTRQECASTEHAVGVESYYAVLVKLWFVEAERCRLQRLIVPQVPAEAVAFCLPYARRWLKCGFAHGHTTRLFPRLVIDREPPPLDEQEAAVEAWWFDTPGSKRLYRQLLVTSLAPSLPGFTARTGGRAGPVDAEEFRRKFLSRPSKGKKGRVMQEKPQRGKPEEERQEMVQRHAANVAEIGGLLSIKTLGLRSGTEGRLGRQAAADVARVAQELRAPLHLVDVVRHHVVTAEGVSITRSLQQARVEVMKMQQEMPRSSVAASVAAAAVAVDETGAEVPVISGSALRLFLSVRQRERRERASAAAAADVAAANVLLDLNRASAAAAAAAEAAASELIAELNAAIPTSVVAVAAAAATEVSVEMVTMPRPEDFAAAVAAAVQQGLAVAAAAAAVGIAAAAPDEKREDLFWQTLDEPDNEGLGAGGREPVISPTLLWDVPVFVMPQNAASGLLLPLDCEDAAVQSMLLPDEEGAGGGTTATAAEVMTAYNTEEEEEEFFASFL